ncbi:hypothetical protein RI367_004434 [Sorochytrium milnesiophthora]
MAGMRFENDTPFAARLTESSHIVNAFPDRVPIIVQHADDNASSSAQTGGGVSSLMRATASSFASHIGITGTTAASTEGGSSAEGSPLLPNGGNNNVKRLPPLDKRKFLVPGDTTVSQFQFVLRRRIHLTAEQNLFLFIKHVAAPPGALPPSDETDDDTLSGLFHLPAVLRARNAWTAVIPPAQSTMASLYEQHKSADGFLYIDIAGENTFG